MARKNNPEAENTQLKGTGDMKPADVLRQFVDVFTDKGWLNRTIRIKRHDRKYTVLCSEKTFIAYRINDNWGLSPGTPGWPVCIIDRDQVVEDLASTALDPAEPGVHDWLCCIANGDFETI